MCIYKNDACIAFDIIPVITDLKKKKTKTYSHNLFLGSSCGIANQEQGFGVMTEGFMKAFRLVLSKKANVKRH